MGYAYQKVTRVSRTHRTPTAKKTMKTSAKRVASKRSTSGKTRRATRRI